jgi:endonuclease YncB( thermonuclease family)
VTFLCAIAAAAVLALLIAAGPDPAAGADRDCGDFSTQADAQSFFIDAGGPRNDPHRLDADGDGVACESLPCPCSRAGAGGGGGLAPKPKPERMRAEVLRAIDGDTVRVLMRTPTRTRAYAGRGPSASASRTRRVTVRLLGIDTPEKYGRRECAAGDASSFTNRFLKGRRVRLTTDPTQDRRDRYGRLLAYVDRGKRSAQVAILARGLAKVYVFDPGLRRAKRFRAAQSKARKARRGAWAKCGGDFHKPARG